MLLLKRFLLQVIYLFIYFIYFMHIITLCFISLISYQYIIVKVFTYVVVKSTNKYVWSNVMYETICRNQSMYPQKNNWSIRNPLTTVTTWLDGSNINNSPVGKWVLCNVPGYNHTPPGLWGVNTCNLCSTHRTAPLSLQRIISLEVI